MISVCLTTYNGEKYIEEQLSSILAQLRPDDEIIVSDDNSEDATLAVIERMHSKQIKVLTHKEEHYGYTRNFENALKHASGDVVFLSDQDDVWMPDKVEKCLEALSRASLVVSDAQIVDAQGNELFPSFYALRRPYASFVGNVVKFGYLGCCMCMKREVLERALPFPPNNRLCTHDNWIFLVAAFFYNTKILNLPLIKYRRHGTNASDGGVKNRTSPWFKVRYRCYLLYHLLLRTIGMK